MQVSANGALRRRLTRTAVLLATLGAIFGSSVSTASAASEYFWNSYVQGTLPGNSITGLNATYRHSITAVSARKLDDNGQQLCVNALNDSSSPPYTGGQAAVWVCKTAYNDLALNCPRQESDTSWRV